MNFRYEGRVIDTVEMTYICMTVHKLYIQVTCSRSEIDDLVIIKIKTKNVCFVVTVTSCAYENERKNNNSDIHKGTTSL